MQDKVIDDTNQFIPICNIDLWSQELRDEFDTVYIDMMQELKSDERLEPLQRQFFAMIDDHGGGRLGMKKGGGSNPLDVSFFVFHRLTY